MTNNKSMHYNFYNQGDAYSLIPTLRTPVVPGETLNFKMDLKVQTAAMTKNLLMGGILRHYLFYVPNRLVWDEWVQFISQDDDWAGTFPTTTANWPMMFERNIPDVPGDKVSSLPRRAYKLIYNQFFGEEDVSANTWYANIETDTDTTVKRCLNTDQYISKVRMDSGMDLDTFDATTQPIDLLAFDQAMRNARSKRRANFSGDKYVDTLRRMGVNPDWRIQMAPEFLGTVGMELKPGRTFNTTGTNQGQAVARFAADVKHHVKNKRFTEHGYVMGVLLFRPHMVNHLYGAPPDAIQQKVEDFYLGDNAGIMDIQNEELIADYSGNDLYTHRFAANQFGINTYGLDDDWAILDSSVQAEDVIYPALSQLPTQNEIGGDEVAVAAHTHVTGRTPFKRLTNR